MSIDPALALQEALVRAIKAASTPAGLNVFDIVPADKVETFPRVTLGSGQSIPAYADGYQGSESFLHLDCWSRRAGFAEVKRVAGAVRDIIDAARDDLSLLPLNEHVLENIEIQSAVFSVESDAKTFRARLTIRALSQPQD